MVMLLVVGCTDHDEEIGVVPDSQNGSELLIEETSGLQFQPEDFVSNLYNGMMTDGKDEDYTPVATTVVTMVGKVMTNAFGNFISQQTPALDKLFETEAGQGKQVNHCWQIESYSFNYHSKSARGEDVVLSGRVTFPNHSLTYGYCAHTSTKPSLSPTDRDWASIWARTTIVQSRQMCWPARWPTAHWPPWK